MSLITETTKHKYALGLLLLFVGFFNHVLACSCKRFTFEENIDSAHWIVIAKINKLELSEEVDENLGSLIEVGYESLKFLKGAPSELQQMLTTTSTCGFDYEIARTYLVLVDQQGQTNICTGTMPFEVEERFIFAQDFERFSENVTAYIKGQVNQIDAFYNPISNRTINGSPMNVESGCKATGK